MASRTTVIATTDYSDLDFLVFTQSGPTTDEGTNPLDNKEYALVGHRYLAFAIGTFD